MAMAQYPQRMGEDDCRDYLRTGRCKYGESCKFNHPPNVQSGGGIKTPLNPGEPLFPIRPNEPPCQYFLKHGTCKFGQTCKFHHPASLVGLGSLLSKQSHPQSTTASAAMITGSGTSGSDVMILPQRPSEPDCIYFLRNGRCKYGATCKYHHPLTYHSICVGGLGESIAMAGNAQAQQQHSTMRHPPSRGRSYSTGSFLDIEGTSSAPTTIPVQFITSQPGPPISQPSHVHHPSGPTHIFVSESPITVMVKHPTGATNASTFHTAGTAQYYSQHSQSSSTPTNSLSQSPIMSSPVISSSVASSYETASSMEFLGAAPTSVSEGSAVWSRSNSQIQGSTVASHLSPQQTHRHQHQYVMLRNTNNEIPISPSSMHRRQQMRSNGQIRNISRHHATSSGSSAEMKTYLRDVYSPATTHSNNSYPPNPGWTSNASLSHAPRMREEFCGTGDGLTHRNMSSSNEASYPSSYASDRIMTRNERGRFSGMHVSTSAPSNLSGHGQQEQHPIELNTSSNDLDECSSAAEVAIPPPPLSAIDDKSNWDDGLSMMTSALLNMMDTPEDNNEQFLCEPTDDSAPLTPQRSNILPQCTNYSSVNYSHVPIIRATLSNDERRLSYQSDLSLSPSSSVSSGPDPSTPSSLGGQRPPQRWSPAWQAPAPGQQMQQQSVMPPHSNSPNVGLYLP